MASARRTSTTSSSRAARVPSEDGSDFDDWILGSDAERTPFASSDEEEQEEATTRPRVVRPRFFDWRRHFPELDSFVSNYEKILKEAEKMEKEMQYTPWPESEIYNRTDQHGDWKVVPLCYTFPATDPAATQWVETNCVRCPETTKLLKSIPGIRTALFSRMGHGTILSSHKGWADLANHVLRCHLALRVPTDREGACGVWVEGSVRHHRAGEILVFDDSKSHKAFNASPSQDRIVLIFDLARPEGMPLGTAEAGHTEALDGFIQSFQDRLKLAMS